MIEGKKEHRTITKERKRGKRSRRYKILKLEKKDRDSENLPQ